MSYSLPIIVIALVIAGIVTALIIRSFGSVSWIVKLVLATLFVVVLVLNSSDAHSGLLDDMMALLAGNVLYAAGYFGGIIIGAILPRKTLD